MRLTARLLLACLVMSILAGPVSDGVITGRVVASQNHGLAARTTRFAEKTGASGAVLQAAGDGLQSSTVETATVTATPTATVSATVTATPTATRTALPTATPTPTWIYYSAAATATFIPPHPTATRQYTNTPLPTVTPPPPSATPPPPLASATPSPLPRPVVATPTGEIPAIPLPGGSVQSPIATPVAPPTATIVPEPSTETPAPTRTPIGTPTEADDTPAALPSATLQPAIFSSAREGKATRAPLDAPSTDSLNPALPISRLILWISAASLTMAALLGIAVALRRARRP